MYRLYAHPISFPISQALFVEERRRHADKMMHGCIDNPHSFLQPLFATNKPTTVQRRMAHNRKTMRHRKNKKIRKENTKMHKRLKQTKAHIIGNNNNIQRKLEKRRRRNYLSNRRKSRRISICSHNDTHQYKPKDTIKHTILPPIKSKKIIKST